MKKAITSLFCISMLLVITGCGPTKDIEITTPETTIRLSAPGVNPLADEPAENGRVAGLGQGLWHGLIAPVTLIMSLFNNNVEMYEVHNNGQEYNLGFLLGVAIVFLLLGMYGRR